MLEPEEVSAILRFNKLGWGAKRIAQELGISRNTAKEYVASLYRQPRRKKALDGQQAWLWERFRRHRGNTDVIRQELAAENGTIVSLRTVEQAVQTYRRAARELVRGAGKHIHQNWRRHRGTFDRQRTGISGRA